jgi:hypothetical protein
VLAGIDVIQLELWKVRSFLHVDQFMYAHNSCKVSIAINEKLKDEVTKREYTDADGLLESHTLSNVFPPPEPAQETLHIVVKVPPARE